MNRLPCIGALLVCTASVASAQGRPLTTATTATTVTTVAPLAIGETFTIESRVLGEVRRINIYAPPGYADSSAMRLPVLYIPDH